MTFKPEPPPSVVGLVKDSPSSDSIWKKWFSHLYNKLSYDSTANNPVKIDGASLWIDSGDSVNGYLGDYPAGAEFQGVGFESKLLWIGDKYAFRAGLVGSTVWDDSNIGIASIGMGLDAQASASYTIAIGNAPVASQISALAFGQGNISSGVFSGTIGHDNEASGTAAFCLGSYLYASHSGSYVLGSGIGTGANRLASTKANSMIIGFGSTSGTFFLEQGKCGVSNDTPLSTLDVGGSAGYKYVIIDHTSSPYTIDNTYGLVIICNNSGGNIALTLPSTSGIDRRFYHIKRTSISGGTVTVYAATGEYIEGVVADAGAGGYPISLQNAPMFICDDTSTNNGWWII